MLIFRSLALFIFCTIVSAENHDVELSTEQIWRYNNLLFQRSTSPAVPLSLMAAQNASSARDDDDLRDGDSSVDRILTGGVPLRSIDSLIAAQLFAPQRFVPESDAALQVRVIVRDYQTQYQRVNTVRMPPKLANVQATIARKWQDIAEPLAQLQLQVIVSDQHNASTDVWTIRAKLAACERLNGAQWLSINTADVAFWQTYSSTAIGQTVQASINYAVEQIYLRYSASLIAAKVVARRGERLQLSASQPDLKVGDTVALWHRDDPQRVVGHLRVSATESARSFAWPIDVHPAAIALGDRIYLSRQPPAPAVFLAPPPLAQCQRDKNHKADDNQSMTSE